MKLLSLKLQNIRSYKFEEINFPNGSVLLSGDIGSGKSTILLSIEFALFGVKKPDLTGNALLRKGKKEASVELKFSIDNNEIIIKRALKKGKNDIKQDSGFIIINGEKTGGTPVELKAKVIELLGYPKELVTKHKDIIYRYTVYTPQEDMKAILFEDSELRLNTLRKVFGIDKYKRIRENCLVYIKELKDRKKILLGKIYDYHEKIKQKELKNHEQIEISKKIESIKPDLEKVKLLLKEKKEGLVVFEKQIQEISELKKNLAVFESKLLSNLNQRKKNNIEIENISKEIDILKKTIPQNEKNTDEKSENYSEQIVILEKEKRELMIILQELKLKINEFNTKKTISGELVQKISKIDKCPTCEQKVTESHKCTINDREAKNIELLNQNLNKNNQELKIIDEKIILVEENLEKLRKSEKQELINSMNKKNLKEKLLLHDKILINQDEIKKEIGLINQNKIEINQKLSLVKDIETDFLNSRKEFEKIQFQDKDLDIKNAGYNNRLIEINNTLLQINKEIKEKEGFKELIKNYSKIQNWMEEYFIKLMLTMEKHVMSQLYREFNESFVEWFNQLIDDETITTRLNDEFTPLVEQNGYDIEIQHLSGGEKTSIALAYRLALNKVINDFISHIMTRDIIILDEPTDGFSDEQLDRVRELLDNINISQIIIVSHETKIETFVDNVLRVSKNEHESQVRIA
jgi:DNA repair protein SbcC/Rad50